VDAVFGYTCQLGGLLQNLGHISRIALRTETGAVFEGEVLFLNYYGTIGYERATGLSWDMQHFFHVKALNICIGQGGGTARLHVSRLHGSTTRGAIASLLLCRLRMHEVRKFMLAPDIVLAKTPCGAPQIHIESLVYTVLHTVRWQKELDTPPA